MIDDLIIALNGYIPYFLIIEDGNLPCQLAGCIFNFARLSSLFWTALYANLLQKAFINETTVEIPQKLTICICLVIPLAISAIPLFFGWYGASGLFCWVRISLESWDQFIISMGIYYGFFFVLMVYNVVVHVKTILYLRKTVAKSSEFYQLLLYPAGTLLSSSVSFADRIYISLWNGNSTVLKVITVLLIEMQGIIDAVIYGTGYNVRQVIKKSCGKAFSRSHELSSISSSRRESLTPDSSFKY